MGKMLKNIFNTIRRLLNWRNKEDEVPQGLEVFDKDGNKLVGVETKLSTIIDRVYIVATNGSFTLTNALFTTNEVFVITNAYSTTDNSPMVFSDVVSADTLTVTYSNAHYNSANPSYFVIGVF